MFQKNTLLQLVVMEGKSYFHIQMLTYFIVYEKRLQNDKEYSQFITKCWDLGLKIGHSVRNIAEVSKNLMQISQQLPTYLKHDLYMEVMIYI